MTETFDRLADIKQRNESDDRSRFPSWQDASWLVGEIERLRAVADEAIARLTVLGEAFDDDCRLDHHGFCQTHLVTKPCEIAETRQFLNRAKPR